MEVTFGFMVILMCFSFYDRHRIDIVSEGKKNIRGIIYLHRGGSFHQFTASFVARYSHSSWRSRFHGICIYWSWHRARQLLVFMVSFRLLRQDSYWRRIRWRKCFRDITNIHTSGSFHQRHGRTAYCLNGCRALCETSASVTGNGTLDSIKSLVMTNRDEINFVLDRPHWQHNLATFELRKRY